MHKFLAACLLFISFASFGQAKRALNLIDKLKYDAAFELLESGATKDTTSASIPFVLANLYLIKDWPQENLDSAFYFSVLSLEKYDLLSEKTLDKHIKDGFGKTRLNNLKNHIDSLAFVRAKIGGTQSDFQLFIDDHKDAAELDSAIYLRNEQAFLTAEKINTINSYKSFMDTYPNATDWSKADMVYQKKLYKKSTQSGKLKDYKQFAKNNPKSPYYEDCVQSIYAIKAGENNAQTLLKFINTYPKTIASKKAVGLIYHSYISTETASTFADKYSKLHLSDSLKKVILKQYDALFPIWSDNQIQLIDLSQTVLVDNIEIINFTSFKKDIYSLKKGEEKQLIGKNGEVYYSGDWLEAIPSLKGFVFLKTNQGMEVVHKNGEHFMVGEKARLIGPFIAYGSKSLWGLKSITNKVLTKAIYDSIWFENKLIFLKSKGKYGPTKPALFFPALDNEPIKKVTFYEEYEWITDSLLWVTNGDKEALLNHNLEVIIPLENQQIDLVTKGWSITKKKGISIPAFRESALTSFKENNSWQIGNSKDSITVNYQYNTSFNPSTAQLLGPSAIIMTWGDSSFVYLLDTLRFLKSENSLVKPILSQNNKAYFYEYTQGKNTNIINSKGEMLDLGEFTKVIALNQHFLQIETKKTKTLYNSKGEQLLTDIDAVSLVNDSTISILKNQQFGLFMPNDSIYIEPAFETKLTHLTDSLWVFSEADKYGIINLKNEVIQLPNFEKIEYWTNGLVFLKRDLQWWILDLKSSQIVETGIITYESITQHHYPTIRYQKGVGIGIFDSQKGVIIKPTFTNIFLEGTSKQPYYRAQKQVEEAAIHIMIYYNLDGKLLFKNIMSEVQFEQLYGSEE